MLTLCYMTLEMAIDFLHLNLKYLFIVVLCKLAWLFLLNVEMYQLNPLNNLSAPWCHTRFDYLCVFVIHSAMSNCHQSYPLLELSQRYYPEIFWLY